ncbi:hypothetical protein OUZ56_023330 [Daphnia magna]|uniref:Uncharacterized protein n=1 Tax=Daphnia magna TaxID=35525 RepID=A0ABR0AYW2_9CRUS|nr:hypothetical protein OUZ56_023330 [Daphnia magna]
MIGARPQRVATAAQAARVQRRARSQRPLRRRRGRCRRQIGRRFFVPVLVGRGFRRVVAPETLAQVTRFVQQQIGAAVGRFGGGRQRRQDGHRQVNFGWRARRKRIGFHVGLIAVLARRPGAQIQAAVGRDGRPPSATAAQIVARIGQANGRARTGTGSSAQAFTAGQQRRPVQEAGTVGRTSAPPAGHSADADIAGRHTVDRRFAFERGDALAGRFRQMDVQTELERVLALERRLLHDAADASARVHFQRDGSVRFHGGVRPRAGRHVPAVVVVAVFQIGAVRVMSRHEQLEAGLRAQPAGAQRLLAFQSRRSDATGAASAADGRGRPGGIGHLVTRVRLTFRPAPTQIRGRSQQDGGRRVGGQAEGPSAPDERPGRRIRSQLVLILPYPGLHLLAAFERLAKERQAARVQFFIRMRVVGCALAAAARSVRIVFVFRQQLIDGRTKGRLQRWGGRRRALPLLSFVLFDAQTMDANGTADAGRASGSSDGAAQTAGQRRIPAQRWPGRSDTTLAAPLAVRRGRMTREGATQHP